MNNKVFVETICPICGEYYFSAPTDDDPDTGIMQCSHCGWIYDPDQINDPECYSSDNKMTLNEYKQKYLKMISDNPNYDYFESTYVPSPHLCPVCGKYSFKDWGSFEICPECGWQDDPLMEAEPDKWAGNANDLCLVDFKKRFTKALQLDSNYRYSDKGIPS